ncbi:hypothetical protein BT69DRAFT_1339081 [Atractiella rhizophila]|nr:hypothetical protein BT69DRAFT_1339081 [Atractiella rhizophila]
MRTQREESNEDAPAQVLKKGVKKKGLDFDGFWADESGSATMEFMEGKVYLPEQYYNEQILTFNKAMFLKTFIYEVGGVDQTLGILQQIGKGQGHVALGFPERGSFYTGDDRLPLSGKELIMKTFGQIAGEGTQLDQLRWTDGNAKSGSVEWNGNLLADRALMGVRIEACMVAMGRHWLHLTINLVQAFLIDSDVEIERAGFQLLPPAFHKQKTPRFRQVEHDDKDFDDFLIGMMEEGEDDNDV